jgi:hypothetical protein
MFTDPEMEKPMRVQQLFGMRMMHSDVVKALGISPEDAKQLKANMGYEGYMKCKSYEQSAENRWMLSRL